MQDVSPRLAEVLQRSQAREDLKHTLVASFRREELGEVFDALPDGQGPAFAVLVTAVGEAWADYDAILAAVATNRSEK